MLTQYKATAQRTQQKASLSQTQTNLGTPDKLLRRSRRRAVPVDVGDEVTVHHSRPLHCAPRLDELGSMRRGGAEAGMSKQRHTTYIYKGYGKTASLCSYLGAGSRTRRKKLVQNKLHILCPHQISNPGCNKHQTPGVFSRLPPAVRPSSSVPAAT